MQAFKILAVAWILMAIWHTISTLYQPWDIGIKVIIILWIASTMIWIWSACIERSFREIEKSLREIEKK